MKTTKIKTERLMFAVINMHHLPVEKILNEKPKDFRVFDDLFAGKDKYAYLTELFPELKNPLDELLAWQKKNGIILYSQYEQIHMKITELIQKYQLSEEYELPVYRSIFFLLAVLLDLEDFPGYPANIVLVECQKDFSGAPQTMLASIIERLYERYNLLEIAYQIKDKYFSSRPQNKEDFTTWQINFGVEIHEMVSRWQNENSVPSYFKM